MIKCVEAKTGGTDCTFQREFTERCQPTQILDRFWHAHMLHPRLYSEHCAAILGASGLIVDHDPCYMSPKTIKGSGLLDKLSKVFKYENRFQDNDDTDNSWRVSSGNMPELFHELLETYYEMCDPGCG